LAAWARRPAGLCLPMIDIHCHILPGLDDGAPDLATSVEMARMAAESGTTDIVASPHSDISFRFDAETVETLIAKLNEACAGAVRIHYGCDFHLHFENIQQALERPAKFTIGHGNYLLVELPELLALKTADEALRRLWSAGVTPIITHPERHGLLQQRFDHIAEWAAAGYLVQITGQSLLGEFGRRARTAAMELLRRNLVHVVASDGHDCQARPPRLDLARAVVAEQAGEAVAERLFTANPGAVLRGEELPVCGEGPAAGRRKWWPF
jgi:protein-tyrosine phosphatase